MGMMYSTPQKSRTTWIGRSPGQQPRKSICTYFKHICNRTMQHRIEEHPDFESTIQNDPIEFLRAIKIVMHDPIRVKYPYASLTEVLMRTLNIKQLEHKRLIDYMKRFKQSRDVLKSHIGGDILNKFVEKLPEYRHGKMGEQCEMKTEAFGRWMAYMMIRNSDQAKYGSLLNGMVSQFLMNNNCIQSTLDKQWTY